MTIFCQFFRVKFTLTGPENRKVPIYSQLEGGSYVNDQTQGEYNLNDTESDIFC